MFSNWDNEDLLMAFSALLETVLQENRICVAFYFNFHLYYFGHMHGNAIGFSSKVQLLLFVGFCFWFFFFLLGSGSFSALSQSFLQQLFLILLETSFYQEVKEMSRSWADLKVHRSCFHWSALYNRQMRGQKCCGIKRWSRMILHLGAIIFLLLWFMIPNFSCFIIFLPLRCPRVIQSSCCSIAGGL